MYIINFKIKNIKLETIEDIVQLEFAPRYFNEVDDTKIFYAESSYDFSTIILKQRGNDIIVAIVYKYCSNGKIPLVSEKKHTSKIPENFKYKLEEFGHKVSIEILDHSEPE